MAPAAAPDTRFPEKQCPNWVLCSMSPRKTCLYLSLKVKVAALVEKYLVTLSRLPQQDKGSVLIMYKPQSGVSAYWLSGGICWLALCTGSSSLAWWVEATIALKMAAAPPLARKSSGRIQQYPPLKQKGGRAGQGL